MAHYNGIHIRAKQRSCWRPNTDITNTFAYLRKPTFKDTQTGAIGRVILGDYSLASTSQFFLIDYRSNDIEKHTYLIVDLFVLYFQFQRISCYTFPRCQRQPLLSPIETVRSNYV